LTKIWRNYNLGKNLEFIKNGPNLPFIGTIDYTKDILYHLLTDSKTFYIIHQFYDYNAAIDLLL
jgi:hypothetical protein